ncbi:MAG: patatin-like phospholipase family protein, partial [Anaerolineae bacterium]
MKSNGNGATNGHVAWPSLAIGAAAAGLLAADTAGQMLERTGIRRARARRANGHMPRRTASLAQTQIETQDLVPAEVRNRAKEFKEGRRLILSCDGGGILGIITLQCLKQLEQTVGAPVFELFDMFAGTSTGAIIAASLAAGVSVDELIALYRDRRAQIFTHTLFHRGPFRWLGRYNIFIPKYDKAPIRRMLREVFQDHVLAELPRDVMITAKDTVRGETTFFTAFHNAPPLHDMALRAERAAGTYKDVLVRAAVEASMSAPTYFEPLGRFVDGGVGSYNNACYAAAVEALRYSGERYREKDVRVYSFGTGAGREMQREGAAQRMKLLDWAEYVIGVSMEDANNQQAYVTRHELCGEEQAIEFRRYQVYFNDAGMAAIGVERPPELAHYGDLALDAIEYFDFLNEVGVAFG